MKNEYYNVEEDSSKVIILSNDGNDNSVLGIGEDLNGVFLVDISEGGYGDELRKKLRVKEGLKVEDVLKIGIDCEIFEKYENEYYINDYDLDELDSLILCFRD